MKRLTIVLLSAAILTPAFGQATKIQLNVDGMHDFLGATSFLCNPPDSSFDSLSCSITDLGVAKGNYTCLVSPANIQGPTTVSVGAKLRNYIYDNFAGTEGLHVANVTLRLAKTEDPSQFVTFGPFPVVMDIPYYCRALAHSGGAGGGEVCFYNNIDPAMPPQEVATAAPDPGYVFTGWTGPAVDLGCVPNPMAPTVKFDFVRYFLTLGMTTQCYLYATFSAANTLPGTDVLVTLTDGDSVVTMNFDEVLTAGSTSVSISEQGPPLATGFRLGQPPVYYDISTTAAYSGNITVCLGYDPDTFQGPLTRLCLFHYVENQWVDCTTHVDTENHIICGTVPSLSPFVVVEPTVINVQIDIKPGSYPNSINRNSKGVIPVAILGSADFDVTQIEPLSLALAGMALNIQNKGTPQCSLEDVNKDGFMDLVCKFVDGTITTSVETTTFVLTGTLLDGTSFEGSDEVRIVP